MAGTGCRPASRHARGFCGPAGRRDLVISTNRTDEVGLHGLHGLDGAGDEGGLSFRDRVVHRDAGTFIQDLDAEDLAAGHGAVFVGPGEGDVEGQDLVAIAGSGQGPQVVQIGYLLIQVGGYIYIPDIA